jgi:hypothetical protein
MTEKPVPCDVCGKEPTVDMESKDKDYCVVCAYSLVTHRIIGFYRTKAAAIAAWNRAMGKEREK